jgi:excinuclease UvrABC nuclease subunit
MMIHSSDHAQRWDMPDWIDPRGHYVYVAWDFSDPDEVLYVGMSSKVVSRLAQHSTDSLWWIEASHVDLHECPSRKAAEEMEAAMIERLDPHYNVVRPFVRRKP